MGEKLGAAVETSVMARGDTWGGAENTLSAWGDTGVNFGGDGGGNRAD